MSKKDGPKEKFFSFKEIDDEPISSSYTIYDFHGIAFPREGSEQGIRSFKPADFAESLSTTWDKMYEQMKKRCKVQPKFFNTETQGLMSKSTGDENVGCRIADDGKKRTYRCCEKFQTPDLCDRPGPGCRDNKPNIAFTFGKIDAMTILPVPHSYWSGVFRSIFLAGKKGEPVCEPFDIINLPSHRIKYGHIEPGDLNTGDPDNLKDQIEQITSISFQKPYIMFTFLQFPKQLIKDCDPPCHIEDKKKCPFLRKNHLKRLCGQLLASEDSQLNKKQQSENETKDNPRLEFFLTFSGHYQGIIKAEADTLEEINCFLDKIKVLESGYLISETATIIALNGKVLMDETRVHEFNNSNEKDMSSFAILIKLKGAPVAAENSAYDRLDYRTDYEICRKIEEVIKSHLHEKEFEINSRPFYWDVLVTIKTKSIYDFVKTIIEDIRGIPYVAHALTIPLWNLSDYPQKSITSLNNKVAQLQKPDYLPECPAWKKRTKQLFATPSKTGQDILKKWEENITTVPRDIQKAKDGELDALAYRIYNQKFDMELIFAYLMQLETGWTTHLLSYPLRTFDLLLHRLENRYDDLLTLAKDRIRMDKGEIKKDNQMLWDKLILIIRDTSILKEVISNLITEYNDKQEGSQISWMTAPYLRIGQRAGVIDLYTEALNDLFKDYCGKLPGKVDLWKGLVTPSSGRDFSISSVFQVLYLPIDIKFHIHGRLPLMAHEAAHFILWCLFEAKDASYFVPEDELEKIQLAGMEPLDERLNEKKRYFTRYIWDEMFRRAEDEAQDMLEDQMEWKKKHVKDHLDIIKDMNPGDLEFLVDILAGLIAGPAYFKSFGLINYQSPQRERKHKSEKDRPLPPFRNYPRADWVRVYLGMLLWQPRHEVQGETADWLQDYWELQSYFKEALASVDLDFEDDRGKQFTEYLSESAPLDPLDEKEPLLKIAGDKVDNFFMDYNTYLVKALFTENRGPRLIKRFVAFFHDIFDDNFYFFGKHGGVIFTRTEASGIAKDFADKSRECRKYASDMVFKNQLILDGRLKDIAASSIMSPIRRPVAPSGSILHSLFYGTGRR